MDLNQISVFVKVAQAGSFTRAARQLGIPNSTASAKVAALERRLGVRLLQRTTRKLRLTDEGETYFRQASQGLDDLERAETELSSSQREPQGIVRVTAPNDFADHCLAELVSAFREKYPKVGVELFASERSIDLVAEGVDVAIRAGELRDSGLVARKLGIACWVPAASPSYLARYGTPTQPQQLREHVCLQFAALGRDDWRFTDGKRTITVPMARRLVANGIDFLKALALSGNGVALLPAYACRAELRSGKLQRILPEWRARADPVHLVYPGRKFVAPRVRVFVDMAFQALQNVFRE